jgi:hypothetical protein
MVTPDELTLAKKLIAGFTRHAPSDRLRGATVPLSAISALIASCVETGRFFPPDVRPEELGDGAVIERLSKHRFKVHERFEIGQMRFSELSAHSYFFLRGAVLRYLKHYRVLLRLDKVTIDKWA